MKFLHKKVEVLKVLVIVHFYDFSEFICSGQLSLSSSVYAILGSYILLFDLNENNIRAVSRDPVFGANYY